MNKNKQISNRLINKKGLETLFRVNGIKNISDDVFLKSETRLVEFMELVCLKLFEEMRIKGKRGLSGDEFDSTVSSLLKLE